MSLDKAINHGKEKRKQYKSPKSIDPSCRNHGSCDRCKGNRLHASNLRQDTINSKLYEYEKGDDIDE